MFSFFPPSPRSRYVAKSFTARDLYEGKDGKDVLEAYLTDKGNGQYHKDVFLLREKAKPSTLLDSSAEGGAITISGMTADDGLEEDDLAQVEVEREEGERKKEKSLSCSYCRHVFSFPPPPPPPPFLVLWRTRTTD